MVQMLMPYAVVEPPPATPPPHGLRASAREIADADSRWEGGIEYGPETCADIFAWSSDCAVPQAYPAAPDNVDCVQAAPYTLIVPFGAQAVGGAVRDDEGRVRRQLEAGTSKGMERQFWGDPLATGSYSLVGATPNAQGSMWDGTPGILNDAATTAPVAVSPIAALGMLGQALGSCGLGSRGMIHAPVALVEYWAQERLDSDGARLMTKGRGDIVVSGSGYPGTGPEGNPLATPPPGTTWAYASGMVEYRLGEIRFEGGTVAEVLDRKQNIVTWYGQRSVVTAVDGCCTFAVLVTLPTGDGGGGGGGTTGGLTDAELRATPVAVDDDGLTNTELRASAVPVSIAAPTPTNTGTTTSVANSITNVTLKAANAARKGLTIYNDATGATLSIKLGATASASSFTVKLVAGAYYEVPFDYTGIVDAIASAAEGNARITELTAVAA